MGFWNDVKEEWMVPVRGTKQQKMELGIQVAGILLGTLTIGYTKGESSMVRCVAFMLAFLCAPTLYYAISKMRRNPTKNNQPK